LTSVIIPNSVTYIGSFAFSGHALTSVTIPGSVTSIDYSAFGGNPLIQIVIGSNVELLDVDNQRGSFAREGEGYIYFPEFYNRNGQKAGTYTYSKSWLFDYKWTYKP
jgi:hypothetical protein